MQCWSNGIWNVVLPFLYIIIYRLTLNIWNFAAKVILFLIVSSRKIVMTWASPWHTRHIMVESVYQLLGSIVWETSGNCQVDPLNLSSWIHCIPFISYAVFKELNKHTFCLSKKKKTNKQTNKFLVSPALFQAFILSYLLI